MIDNTKRLRICIQNTQHDFQIYGDGLEMPAILNNLRELEANIFCLISPNINWNNQSQWIRTKRLFRPIFQHVHISAISSRVGLKPPFSINHLIGGAAILTLGLWSSKVYNSFQDPSGCGTFTVTAISGKFNRYLSIILADTAVQKGSNIGSESLFTQQMMIYEQNCSINNFLPNKSCCPRTNAIKLLYDVIEDLQQKNRAIILVVDANQTLKECYKGNQLRPHSIEWLHLQGGLDDPFVRLTGAHPHSTTLTPLRDIDFILTHGIQVTHVTTLHPNTPACSDHLGMVLDIDAVTFFSS